MRTRRTGCARGRGGAGVSGGTSPGAIASTDTASATRGRFGIRKENCLRYAASNSALIVALGPREQMVAGFEAAYRKQLSFLLPNRPLVAAARTGEAIPPR